MAGFDNGILSIYELESLWSKELLTFFFGK